MARSSPEAARATSSRSAAGDSDPALCIGHASKLLQAGAAEKAPIVYTPARRRDKQRRRRRSWERLGVAPRRKEEARAAPGVGGADDVDLVVESLAENGVADASAAEAR